MPVWLNKSCGRALSRDFALRSNSRESLRRAATSASVQRLLYFTQARPRARAARNIALRDFKTACDGRRVPIGSDRIGSDGIWIGGVGGRECVAEIQMAHAARSRKTQAKPCVLTAYALRRFVTRQLRVGLGYPQMMYRPSMDLSLEEPCS